MRIGKFAERLNTTQDTIRFYIKRGLLVPPKVSGQYRFSEADCRDLERILELKEMHFSLTEIQKIITFQRLTGSNTEEFRRLYLSLLEEKNKKVSHELIKYNRLSNSIRDSIHKIKAEELENSNELGFPIHSLDLLSCPLCRENLMLSDGVIEKNMIMDANISCRCGYIASIRDGIFIDEETARTKLMHGKPMPTKEEYLESSSHKYINFLYQGMAGMIEMINKYTDEPKYILELENCVGFFLMQYIKYLPPKTTYILIDYDPERIIKLKKNLEMFYDHKNFIFLCCDLNKLPIIENSIDVALDFWMTNDYAKSHGEFLPKKGKAYLKHKGIWIGANPCFGDISSGKINNTEYQYYNKEKILKEFVSVGFEIIETDSFGPVIENNPYNSDLKDHALYQLIYAGNNK
ncbi:MAG: MerR family transcriptional regulator [Dethiosulfatibacter sp.]|nr:MerR family transcriptional regulator [Dethiosulfatibacter sp.]